MNLQATISIAVFLVALILIMSEKVNRTIAAVGGAIIILLTHIIENGHVTQYIDFNTIGVLIGMMILVSIVKDTGLFEYVAIFMAKKAHGNPWKIILSFCIFTAITSALLDNVTTVLLVAPMMLVITEVLETDPVPFLIPVIMASNIGGTSTLIGDPPNIMIGSAAGLGFMDFVVNLMPIIIVIFIVTFFLLYLLYGKKMKASEAQIAQIMGFDEKKAIENPVLLKKSLVVLALVVVGFFFHEKLEFPSALIAVTGAVVLLAISKQNIEEIFQSVEWPTIFFFGGLFVMVGGLEATGLIEKMATSLIEMTDGQMLLTGVMIIWISAIVSSFLDNIPFVATLIPLIQTMGASGVNVTPLWWAVSLGACLGGNGTLIGASANVVVAGIAEKSGYKISFMRYMKTGFPLMLVSIVLSTVYLVIFYLM